MTYEQKLAAFNEWAFWNDLPAVIVVGLIVGAAICVLVHTAKWSERYLTAYANRPLTEDDDVLS